MNTRELSPDEFVAELNKKKHIITESPERAKAFLVAVGLVDSNGNYIRRKRLKA